MFGASRADGTFRAAGHGSLFSGGSMYVIALILFLGGVFLVGISFSLAPIQALVFILGILCVSAALALPVHLSNRRT
jgi:hypothetical protein